VIAILGAGPHGQQIAALLKKTWFRGPQDVHLYDDSLPGFQPIADAFDPVYGCCYTVGALWPKVRRTIRDKTPFPDSPAWDSGRIIFPGVQIGHDAQLGEHVHVLYNAVVSHGCQVGDFVTICSGAVLAGEVTVEHGAFIGANATIRHGGITIGRNAIVGMGAVVVDDVPDNTKVVGNPAKVLQTL
jgi:acetyltransferase-like isoleucine patch superfamily enzyme